MILGQILTITKSGVTPLEDMITEDNRNLILHLPYINIKYQ